MTYACVRSDLREARLSPPLKTMEGKEGYFCADLDAIFECMQPECWNNEFYNLLLVSSDGKEIYYGASIDFEFSEDMEKWS